MVGVPHAMHSMNTMPIGSWKDGKTPMSAAPYSLASTGCGCGPMKYVPVSPSVLAMSMYSFCASSGPAARGAPLAAMQHARAHARARSERRTRTRVGAERLGRRAAA
jgi:hypothetical protein